MMQKDQHAGMSDTFLIRLGAAPDNKEKAIRAVGEMLVQSGSVESEYVESMLKREAVARTWLGEGVAIPHGLVEDRDFVLSDRIALLQIPDGVEWNDNQKAYLVFGIAARGDGHLATLQRLTRLLQNPGQLTALFTTTNADDIIKQFVGIDNFSPEQSSGSDIGDLSVIRKWVVDYPNGLHARPASVWIDAVKRSDIQFQVRSGRIRSDIRSLVSVLQVGARYGDELVFSASGENAEAKIDNFMKIVRKLSVSEKEAVRQTEARNKKNPVYGWQPPSGRNDAVVGVSASPGLAIGKVFRLVEKEIVVADVPGSLTRGGEILREALGRTRLQMKAMIDDVTRRIGAFDAAIFKAQAELLDDDHLIVTACRYMVEGHGVAWSWYHAVEEAASRLAATDNVVLAARATDLRDVGKRVLEQIDPVFSTNSTERVVPEKAIIVADDLSPSDTAGLNTGRVQGLVTAGGGPTSHTAILARTLGLPAVVAVGSAMESAHNGMTVIIDGDSGRIWLDPDEADLSDASEMIRKAEEKLQLQAKQRRLPGGTSDGYRILVTANINRPDQVPLALDQGGEGVGLMRTEFLFLEKGYTPDEDEQYETYKAMMEALEGKHLVVRALDIGGDKQVAYLDLPREDNPFLGVRGARLLLGRPDLLYPQLKALYRVAKEGAGLSVMFPMITSIDEVRKLRTMAEYIRIDMKAPEIPLGIMIEVPSAAVMADKLAASVDFFSIGTNDLTQYTLAVDRQNPELAAKADSLHPAVLRMIRLTVQGAKKHNRPVGVCGGIAGDPFGAILLAGLGITELSMTPRDIVPVKSRLRETSLDTMQKLARKAVRLETAEEVRALERGKK